MTLPSGFMALPYLGSFSECISRNRNTESNIMSVILVAPVIPTLQGRNEIPQSKLASKTSHNRTDDALGHDTPPAAICSCSACMTEPPLLQLFPSLMGRRADDSGNSCDHWRNPSYSDPPLYHCCPVLL
ncbi:hypothetical protein H671_5g14993 [Cricetulus griseus]|uniref:Uncharacterized protein n=1 Tax=Cricetulus griseus TaxID=10029 RepID=A0A061I004_CRIGR|nr:hypothetical protein H671_5g14993 [Cricetulus griseus]